ncbi:MAG TPA: aminotransferase class I/II-fold pyridoxal phosphate-dependent enzyme, partial [Stellaceae bacterium]|nr:aminotransferase class I/II-fold pyridoxal phosphate-dependent enzyme [Stellaceae bacterium]
MAGFELIDDEERHAVDAVMRSTVLFAHGFDGMRNGVFKVREFEQEFAAKMGSPWAQAVSSGTAALLVGLKALGVGPGDEVITQSHTFVATVEAILAAGASPVIAEVDDTLNLDTAALESLITARTRAIIPVHMLGVAADMASIMRIAERHKLAVLEDTAQAVGASFRGRRLGTFGDAAAFSFDHGKAL